MDLKISRNDIESPASRKYSDDSVISEQYENGRSQNCCTECLRDNLFMILVLIGVAFGFGIGFAAKYAPDQELAQIWIQMPGDLYVRVLQLTILPLISANLIVVIASIDSKQQGRTSLLCLASILGFNIVSAALGIALAAVINPGGRDVPSGSGDKDPNSELYATTSDIFVNLFKNLFPDNIIGIAIYQSSTIYELNETAIPPEKNRIDTLEHGTDMIGVLFVSITFGLAAKASGEEGKPFINFFRSLAKVVLVLIKWFLKLTPIGVCFMIAGAIIKVENIAKTFSDVGLLIATVFVGSIINNIVAFLLFVFLMRRNPFKFLPHCMKAWFVSFATTSPIVALPEMYQGCDDYGIDFETSRFICPLSVTLKGDGPAIFIASSAMFITQMSVGTVPVGTAVVIWLLTSAAVLAIPHIPSASIVIILTILSSVGVPSQNASLLYAVDWLLDRLRCVTSCISTMMTVAIIDNDMKKHKLIDQEDESDSQSSSSS